MSALILFIGVVITVLTTAHWYLWRRLVRDVSAPGSTFRRIGTVLAFLLPALMVAAQVSGVAGVPFSLQQVLAWPGFYWAVALLYLTLALLAGEPVRLLWLRRRRAQPSPDQPAEPAAVKETASVGRVARPGGPPAGPGPDRQAAPEADRADGSAAAGPEPSGHSRRLFVARTVAIGATTAATGVLGYGTYRARNLTTRHVTVPLAHLPRSAHGYRIAVVADIHLGPVLGQAHCRRVVDAVNRTQPDLITVVGDLVDADVDDLRAAAAPLAELSAREGTFFVTGNHEYYVGADQWTAHVRELGMEPLENARRELSFFDLAGVNDVAGEDYGAGPDFEAALGDRDPQRTSVLMAHQPVLIHDAVDHGVDLQLSGHTHGGQLWPVNYLAGLANPTLEGLEKYGDTQLYVTRGAGAWGPPVRVGADPDITVVELASGRA
ncbi:metallophosphoesterase [Streptomyces sp. ACA25]|uniref:metallophosphoesterase n=1 Tax=Streptomyces sp. ACA25 TaxID=3022596 RepID=UPI0023076224|nr:metallophosphoesterase [Streptomyces sp. ACA25]MDB1087077.1 metallophosphoesterase [Streptomyces sp. ACA25]